MADRYSEHWNAGNACYERGDLDAALHHFTQALQVVPDSVPARYNLGVVHRDLENWEAAWILFIDVIARDRNAAAAYNNLAIVEEHLGLYAAAETHYRQAITLKKQFPDAHFNLGMLLLRLGAMARGVCRMRSAVANQPIHSLSGASPPLEWPTAQRRPAGS